MRPCSCRLLLFLAVICGLFSSCGNLPLTGKTPEIPYSFPRLSSTSLSLEGDYRFITDPENRGLLRSYHLPACDDSNWRTLKAPGNWESQGVHDRNPNLPGDWLPYGGYAWLRRWVEVPADWIGRDLEINLGRVDDQQTCYWNGKLAGESTGRDQDNIYILPSQDVRYGEKNILAVRVFDAGGEGGIVDGPLTLRPVFLWEGLQLSVQSPDDTHIYDQETGIPLDITINNPMKDRLDVTMLATVTNYDAKEVFREQRDLRLAPDSPVSFVIEVPSQPRGHYDVRLDIRGGGLILKTFWSSFAVLGPRIQIMDVENSPFGLCGGALFHMDPPQIKTLGKRRLAQIQRIGAAWGRNDIWWGQVEPARGQWEFSKADSVVSMFRRHEINLLGILCYSTDWMNGQSPVTDDQIAAFANYAARMARRYEGRVSCWEVWNEPNAAPFWTPTPRAADYVRLLKATYQAVKQVSPDIRIVGMSTKGVDLDFIEECLRLGAGEYLDILSVHPFQDQPPTERTGETELEKIGALRALMDANGCNRPIWITDCGWPTVGDITERLQAEYLVKFYVSTLSGGLVQKIFWFNLTDWGGRFSPSGGHFGLSHIDHTPKPSLTAYYTMLEMLSDYTMLSRVELPDNFEGYDFTFQDGRRVRVIWNNGAPADMIIPRGAVAINIMGRPLEPEGRRIVLDTSPVYLTGDWQD